MKTSSKLSQLHKHPLSRNTRSNGTSAGEKEAAPVCYHPRETLKPLFATRDYITGERFVVGYCNACKLDVTTPVPPESDVARYYPSGYYGAGQRFTPIVEVALRALYSYRVRNIERHQNPGKVLDIGCGRGLLLANLRVRGWDPYGTELSEQSATYARDVLKLPVITKSVEEIGYPDNEFDMVVLWHVFEHVYNPRKMLREVSRILKPGGTLLIAVPNFGSWEAQWTGKYWFHLDVPRHLTHFTPDTLRQVLDDAGLSVEASNFFSSEYDFYSFVQSMQNKMGLRHNLLYNLLRTRSAKVLHNGGAGKEAGAGQIVAALLTAIPLGLLSIVYAPVVAALGRGATMAVYAVKRPNRTVQPET